jgi:enoyl-[acyl-carrier-protein] reductase (NADH)
VDEVIGTAILLASDESAFTTGQIIAVDGGFLASGVNQ